jgi:hypothetical protein
MRRNITGANRTADVSGGKAAPLGTSKVGWHRFSIWRFAIGPHWLARYRAPSLWEVVLVSDGKVTNRAATAYYRCEVGETLQGGHCGLEAEAEFQGLLLCEWHVRQSEAYDRIDLLRGIVTSLDLCLRNVLLRKDTNLVRLLRYRRAHASQELHRAHEDLRQATKMVGCDRQ